MEHLFGLTGHRGSAVFCRNHYFEPMIPLGVFFIPLAYDSPESERAGRAPVRKTKKTGQIKNRFVQRGARGFKSQRLRHAAADAMWFAAIF